VPSPGRQSLQLQDGQNKVGDAAGSSTASQPKSASHSRPPTSHGKSGQADIGLKPASNPSPLEGIRSGAPAARLLQGRSQGSRDYMTSMLPLETRCLSVSRNQAVLTVQRSVLLSFGGVPLNASLRFLSLYFSHVGIHIHTYITLL
jgi:hypothetical protein